MDPVIMLAALWPLLELLPTFSAVFAFSVEILVVPEINKKQHYVHTYKTISQKDFLNKTKTWKLNNTLNIVGSCWNVLRSIHLSLAGCIHIGNCRFHTLKIGEALKKMATQFIMLIIQRLTGDGPVCEDSEVCAVEDISSPLEPHPWPPEGTKLTLGSFPQFSAFKLGRLAGKGTRRTDATLPSDCMPCLAITVLFAVSIDFPCTLYKEWL